jgi:hypothetical protein
MKDTKIEELIRESELRLAEKKTMMERTISLGDFDPYTAAIFRIDIYNEEESLNRYKAMAREEKIDSVLKNKDNKK